MFWGVTGAVFSKTKKVCSTMLLMNHNVDHEQWNKICFIHVQKCSYQTKSSLNINRKHLVIQDIFFGSPLKGRTIETCNRNLIEITGVFMSNCIS